MKKILIVDDSAVIRSLARKALAEAGFWVVEAVDGVDAYEKLDPTVAMMVCDVNMPRLNGIDLLEKIRMEPKWRDLPVVMLTTEGQPALINRAKKAGVKGWVVKPFRASLLVAAAQRLTVDRPDFEPPAADQAGPVQAASTSTSPTPPTGTAVNPPN